VVSAGEERCEPGGPGQRVRRGSREIHTIDDSSSREISGCAGGCDGGVMWVLEEEGVRVCDVVSVCAGGGGGVAREQSAVSEGAGARGRPLPKTKREDSAVAAGRVGLVFERFWAGGSHFQEKTLEGMQGGMGSVPRSAAARCHSLHGSRPRTPGYFRRRPDRSPRGVCARAAHSSRRSSRGPRLGTGLGRPSHFVWPPRAGDRDRPSSSDWVPALPSPEFRVPT
jgi:hypothetical protein